MRGGTIAGLCLAVLALNAIVASPAQAGEYGLRAKAMKVGRRFTGHFLDRNCTVGATKAQIEEGKKNKYEWVSAAGTKYVANTRTVELNYGGGTVLCKKSTDEGARAASTAGCAGRRGTGVPAACLR